MKNIHLQIIQAVELYRVVNSDKLVGTSEILSDNTEKNMGPSVCTGIVRTVATAVFCVSKVKSNIGQNLGRFIVLTMFMGSI